MSSQQNPLRTLNAFGQSIWYDNIHRSMLMSGELSRLIREDDLRGITSNPSIFDKAISGGKEYDEALKHLVRANPGLSSRELFFALAIEDIRTAADLLLPVYQATGGVDGMVSLEVSPDLAYDAETTVHEALDLHGRLDRPNVMIKVPATRACLPAIEQLIAEGVNINITLLFSVDRYREVTQAHLQGLEQRLKRGKSVDRVASVASFFVSRIDSALDPLLAEKAPDLQGKIAIANAKQAYQHYKTVYQGQSFKALAKAGAHPQRLLWASTSTKNPAYSDLLYVESLIGPQTVNTVPPDTYNAFRDHGVVAATLDDRLDSALAQLASLATLDIDLAVITDRLEKEGVAAFAQSFTNLLVNIEAKTAALALLA